jgi:hypothetical protein
VSEQHDSGFKPVAPMPEHKDHQHSPSIAVPHPMAVPMPSASSGLTTEGMTIKPASVMAVIALILGILSFILPIFALPALIVSILGMKQTAGNRQSGRGMAIAGLVLSIIGILAGIFWISIFVFSFFASKGAMNAATRNPISGYSSGSSSSTEKSILTGTVKQPVDATKYTLTVNSIEHGFKGTRDYYTPAVGNEYVLVNITLKNKDSYSQYYSSYDFSIKDDTGASHDNKYMIDIPSDFSYKTVESGRELTGNIVFEVPISSTRRTLIYTPSYYSTQQSEITL